MSIPDHVIDQLVNQADLVSIIGQHTSLKKSGNSYKGCCPFHKEKTPSFHVTPSKGLYHCFGCKASGNAITFLTDYERLSFLEALEVLSKQTGISLPKQSANPNLTYQKTPSTSKQTQPASPPTQGHATVTVAPSLDDMDAINASLADAADINEADFDASIAIDSRQSNHNSQSGQPQGNLYELVSQLAEYYQTQLKSYPKALLYLSNRGLNEESIEFFQLGYAPNGWQDLHSAFPNDIEGLKMLGLIRQSDSGREYGLLRDRIIFPIHDHRGRVIGFAGRGLEKDATPKYINSPESVIFHKQHILYGMYQGRQKRADNWLVVEGYMDVISLYQSGIYGAVAPMGTALGESQIKQLFQQSPLITLGFDSDQAGQQAAWRSLHLALPHLSDERELRFLALPQGTDPDSYIRDNGKSAMLTQIKDASPLSDYVYAKLTQAFDTSSAEGKSKLLAKLKEITTALPQKGSFRWLLSDEIRNRLGVGRRRQAADARDVLLNFDSEITASIQLQLCLLFQPDYIHDGLIPQIYQAAGISTTDTTPSLTFQDIVDSKTYQIVAFVLQLNPSIWQEVQDANHKAHFILAALSVIDVEQQQQLIKLWQDFYQGLTQRNIDDVSFLLTERILAALIESLAKKITQRQDIVIKNQLKNQQQLLSDYKRQHRSNR